MTGNADLKSRMNFSVSEITSLKDIPKGAHIHVIGVCGVAMAQMAILLSQQGYQVSGSDKEFYEPMGGLLRNSKVTLKQGYSASNLEGQIDLVVIGNVVSAGHEEALEVERRKIPYTIFPKLLHELIIEGRHSMVVSGTHGKTTTSAMWACVLRELLQDPAYFVGGAALDLPSSLSLGGKKFSVVEGDEYDSAFFAKVPKFSFYRPDTLIVTSVEYDHADIYPDLAAINSEFDKLVLGLPQGARAIVCVDGDNLRALYNSWKSRAKCELISYGKSEAEWKLESCTQTGASQEVRARDKNGNALQFSLNIPGSYNALNALAVAIACESCGFDRRAVVEALASFHGVKRRQEVRFKKDGLVVIEDFAHHPTAVRETITGVKQAYPQHKLIAIFEPRSNTSRRKVFQNDYVQAFSMANQVHLFEVALRHNDSPDDLIDVGTLASEISATGTPAQTFKDVSAKTKELALFKSEKIVILVMSNGSFGGLLEKLLKELEG